MICIGKNCTKIAQYKKLKICNTHYWRLKRTGTIQDPKYLSNEDKNMRRRYNSIIQRCNNPNDWAYKDYGRRGIKVCDKWQKSVVAFIKDIGYPPSPKHSIDRIDNDGNYENGNVRWVLRDIQTHNQRGRAKTGYKGVYEFRNKYRCQIMRGKERLYGGSFDTAVEAHQKYLQMRKLLYGY